MATNLFVVFFAREFKRKKFNQETTLLEEKKMFFYGEDTNRVHLLFVCTFFSDHRMWARPFDKSIWCFYTLKMPTLFIIRRAKMSSVYGSSVLTVKIVGILKDFNLSMKLVVAVKICLCYS